MLCAQLLRVRNEHEASRRIGRPYPYGKHYGDQQTLHGPRRHVEDHAFFFLADGVAELVVPDGSQVVADQVQMPVPLQRGHRLENPPGVLDERLEAVFAVVALCRLRRIVLLALGFRWTIRAHGWSLARFGA